MAMFCVIITHLVVHFEFLYDSEIICLPLNIIEKLYWQHLFEKLGEAETIITFISVNKLQHPLILKNNIDYSSKMGPPPFFHSDINPVLCHVLVHSIDMFWLEQWDWFSFCSWIYFHSTLFKRRSNLLGSKDLEEAMCTTLFPVVVSTNHCQSFNAFWLDIRCS